jgi:hypothetical protein
MILQLSQTLSLLDPPVIRDEAPGKNIERWMFPAEDLATAAPPHRDGGGSSTSRPAQSGNPTKTYTAPSGASH